MGPKKFKKADDVEKDNEMEGNFPKKTLSYQFKFLEISDELSEEEDEEMEEDEVVNDDQPENMEKLNFDFEALPPDPEDVNQIGNLLTQVCHCLLRF